MTAPLFSLRDLHTADVVALEDELAQLALGPMGDALDDLLAKVTALWVNVFGGVDADPDPEKLPGFRTRLVGLLDAVPTTLPVQALTAGLGRASALGARQASVEAGIAATIRPRPATGTVAQLGAIADRVDEALDTARRLARAGAITSFGDAAAVAGAARQAATTTERTVRWATNRAVSDGVTRVCDDTGIQRVWVPERDGCLHCLRYAGEVADPGGAFPGGLTYGDKPLADDDVPNPPLHPNCRCRISPWRGSDQLADGVDYPSALRREADRAVLLGRSVEGSQPALVRAADRLLTAGVTAPATVKKKAAAAVAAGTFQ